MYTHIHSNMHTHVYTTNTQHTHTVTCIHTYKHTHRLTEALGVGLYELLWTKVACSSTEAELVSGGIMLLCLIIGDGLGRGSTLGWKQQYTKICYIRLYVVLGMYVHVHMCLPITS